MSACRITPAGCTYWAIGRKSTRFQILPPRLVILGYYTGLRLSDVANLELGEIDRSGAFLRIVPNKVRTRKPRPLTIPLVREAKEIVAARMKTSDPNGYLFPPLFRNSDTVR